MPVDKFGRMSDTKTKDTGVSLTYINNNYIRNDGGTPVTGSIDMRGNTLYNVSNPVNPQDVANKEYLDNTKGSGVIGGKNNNVAKLKANLDFTGVYKIENLPPPVEGGDAANRVYVDSSGEDLRLDLRRDQAFVFLENKYQAKNVISMRNNPIKEIGEPQDGSDAVSKNFVESITAFTQRNGGYDAKGSIYLRKNKLGGLREPTQEGEAATKKYVDDIVNKFTSKDGDIVVGKNVNMLNKRIFALAEPTQDSDAAPKKYIDNIIEESYIIDDNDDIILGRNINAQNKRIFTLAEPTQDSDAATKKYVDDLSKQTHTIVDAKGNIAVNRNIDLQRNRIFFFKGS